MVTNPDSVAALPSDWKARRGPAAGLEGLKGRIRLGVGDETIGCLKVTDGSVEIVSDCETEAELATNSLQTLVGILGGEKHPIVARLQGYLSVSGDIGFIVRVFLGLQAGSPWSGLVRKGQP